MGLYDILLMRGIPIFWAVFGDALSANLSNQLQMEEREENEK